MIRNIFATLWARIFAGLAAVFLLGFLTQTIRIEGFWFIVGFKGREAILRIDLDQARAHTEAEIAKHEATKRAYVEAQAEAERMENERVARVTAQQERINNERLASYSQRLADARATANRLRHQARQGAGAGSPSDCEQVPGASGASGSAGASCGDGFSIDRRLTATKQAIQLDELITTVQQQGAVPVN